jgi:cytoskeletal protein CcmA (bactofilin family)
MSFFGMQNSQPSQTADTQSRAEATPVAEEREPVSNIPKSRSITVVAKGTTLSGALKGDGAMEVDGTVEGELEMKGSVVITPTGLVNGPITADVVRVAGHVAGDVNALEHLLVESTGSIEGDVIAKALVVEHGGVMNGRITMKHTEQPQTTKVNEAPPKLDNLQFGPDFKVTDEEEVAAKPGKAGK